MDKSMKKVVVKLAVHDEQDKQKALKAVSGLSGIESLGLDMKDRKLTIIGDIDPVDVVAKLRKKWHTEIVSVGVPDKKKEEEAKKDAAKKDDAKKDDEEKQKKTEAEQIAELVQATKKYYECQPYVPHHYCY